MKQKEITAICILTHPDEDDMFDCVEGILQPCDVKIYYKGKKYTVYPGFNKRYYKLAEK